jgi:hypothetical protein
MRLLQTCTPLHERWSQMMCHAHYPVPYDFNNSEESAHASHVQILRNAQIYTATSYS